MKTLILMLLSSTVLGDDFTRVKTMVENNGFNAPDRVIQAVVDASHTFGLNPRELAAIGLIESGLKYKIRTNRNGTIDQGIFQINSVNWKACEKFNLINEAESAHCAAKLLKRLKNKHKDDYLGRYHSNTLSKKKEYLRKINQVLEK